MFAPSFTIFFLFFICHRGTKSLRVLSWRPVALVLPQRGKGCAKNAVRSEQCSVSSVQCSVSRVQWAVFSIQ